VFNGHFLLHQVKSVLEVDVVIGTQRVSLLNTTEAYSKKWLGW
jgi:hypothetical protein